MADLDTPQPCIMGRCCDGAFKHGWDCPQSDPVADTLALFGPPLDDPILEQSRRAMLAKFGVEVRDEP